MLEITGLYALFTLLMTIAVWSFLIGGWIGYIGFWAYNKYLNNKADEAIAEELGKFLRELLDRLV